MVLQKIIRIIETTETIQRTKQWKKQNLCPLLPFQVGEEACPLDPFVVIPDRSKYVDQQTLKLQEKPEDVPVGEMPRALLLSVDRHLVHLATPGKRVSVVGIFDIFGGNKEGK